jgi:hypothetical protein
VRPRLRPFLLPGSKRHDRRDRETVRLIRKDSPQSISIEGCRYLSVNEDGAAPLTWENVRTAINAGAVHARLAQFGAMQRRTGPGRAPILLPERPPRGPAGHGVGSLFIDADVLDADDLIACVCRHGVPDCQAIGRQVQLVCSRQGVVGWERAGESGNRLIDQMEDRTLGCPALALR